MKLNLEEIIKLEETIYELYFHVAKNAPFNTFFLDKNHFWEFYIKDNGKGIAEKYHKKIFEIFQSIDVEQNTTGIGLSIVKRIIEFCGGEIWLTSELTKGTTFYFTIPKNIK